MKQKTRKTKAVANTVLPTVVNGKDLMASIERSNRRERPTMDIPSSTPALDKLKKAINEDVQSRTSSDNKVVELQKDNYYLADNNIKLVNQINEQKQQIHRLNSQVGGYKKNLNDSKDTIKALSAGINELKAINLTARQAHATLVRKREANDVFISQLERDLRIDKDNISNLTKELKSIKSKWWYKLMTWGWK